jgi:hypothetical protein
MSDWNFRVLDLRWLLYRQACRWQLGETDGRWVAVAIMATVEASWTLIGLFCLDSYMEWHLQWPSRSAGWVFMSVLYAVNWWLIVPRGGLAPFESRFRQWPAQVRALEAPFAVLVTVGWVVAAMLKVWTWF